MTIEETVRITLQSPETPKGMRSFLKLVLGEFNRVDDGKPINDDQAIAVLKSMTKSNNEMLLLVDHVEVIALQYENRIMKELMPVENIAADMDMLIAIEKSIPEGTPNKVRFMKPCVQYLEDKDFTVDKKRLSELLRGML